MGGIYYFIEKAKTFFLLDKTPDREIARNNVQRILFMFYILSPLHVVLITLFYSALQTEGSPISSTVYHWRMGIIITHAAMLIISSVIAYFTYHLKLSNREASQAGKTLPLLLAFFYLLFGAVLCIIDQLVTSSINPYLIVNIAVAMIIMIRPPYAVLFYLFNFALFYLALPLTQSSPELLLSVRVNGIGAALIGLGLALLIWRSNSLNLTQQNLIMKQKNKLQEKNRQLKEMARADMLTGIYNRMCFTEFAESELARNRRTGGESSLIFLDLDNFKEVNDSYGHPAGDIVLKLIAGVIRGQLRETDILARFGGDEFAVLLPETNIEGALRVAEKIREAIENCKFTGRLEKLHLTASLGIAPLSGSDDATFDDAYSTMDGALYKAKEKGRNRVEQA